MKSIIETNEYQKINDDIKFILLCYEEMLTRINEKETIKLLKLNQVSHQEIMAHSVSDEKITQALGIYFQLITLVEENAAKQYHRQLENEDGITAIRGSWGETFELWIKQGLSEDRIIELMKSKKIGIRMIEMKRPLRVIGQFRVLLDWSIELEV